MRGWRLILAMAGLLATSLGASGYALLGSKWTVSPVVMHLELGSAGTLLDGSTSWDQVGAGALGTWNYYLLGLQFTTVTDSNTPRDHDGVNNVFFANTIYGSDFGDAVAVTTEWDVRGKSTARSEADVIFNATLSWNSYRGPLKFTSGGDTIYDLRRVALHEFGHVVGLDHPDAAGQTVTSIMNSRVSNLDALQKDDIQGGQFLYGAQPGTYAEDIATVEKPKSKIVTASARTYLFLGFADPSRVQAISLTNSSVGTTRFFKAKGLVQWKREVPINPGRNVITFYVRGADGIRRKVDQRVVIRTGLD